MCSITLSVQDPAGTIRASASGMEEAWLVYEGEYAPGDRFSVCCGHPNQFLILRLDDGLPSAFVFCKGQSCAYPIPFGEAKKVFPPHAFSGTRHYLYARLATLQEIAVRKNLALNPWVTYEMGGPYVVSYTGGLLSIVRFTEAAQSGETPCPFTHRAPNNRCNEKILK